MLKLMRILMLPILVGTIGCSKYTEYVPTKLVVKGGDHNYVTDRSLISTEHIAAMTNVLGSNGEDYRVRNGTLLVRSRLARDRELLANYTSKALDLQDAGMVDKSRQTLRPPSQSGPTFLQ